MVKVTKKVMLASLSSKWPCFRLSLYSMLIRTLGSAITSKLTCVFHFRNCDCKGKYGSTRNWCGGARTRGSKRCWLFYEAGGWAENKGGERTDELTHRIYQKSAKMDLNLFFDFHAFQFQENQIGDKGSPVFMETEEIQDCPWGIKSSKDISDFPRIR